MKFCSCKLQIVILAICILHPVEAQTANWNPLPDTGQLLCYDIDGSILGPCPSYDDSLYGQDAQFHSPNPSYTQQTISYDNVLIDNNTGLMWQEASADLDGNSVITEDDKGSWQEAVDFCQDLTYANYSDWRLPSFSELESIMDYGNNPAINSDFQCQPSFYWSATTAAVGDLYAHIIIFGDGNDGYQDKTAQNHFRCVRGENDVTEQFNDNGDGSITDLTTGLVWQETTADSNGDGYITTDDKATWEEALTYCKESGWRLPNARELKSLVKREGGVLPTDPLINPVFESQRAEYWTSTSCASSPPEDQYYTPDGAWPVSFQDGRSHWSDKSANSHYVRCVKEGLKRSYNLDVTIVGLPEDQVTSSPAGISCPDNCDYSYLEGTEVTLTAVPSSSSSFWGWSGACTGLGDCTLTVNSAMEVTANFGDYFPNIYNLNVFTEGNGTGSIGISPDVSSLPGASILPASDTVCTSSYCGYEYEDGTTLTLVAAEESGSEFLGWSGACEGTINCVVAMSQSQNVTALFGPTGEIKYTLDVKFIGNGTGRVVIPPETDCTSDCTEEFSEGNTLILVAEPDSSSNFAGWFGECSGTETCSVTMDKLVSVLAKFTPKYDIGVEVSAESDLLSYVGNNSGFEVSVDNFGSEQADGILVVLDYTGGGTNSSTTVWEWGCGDIPDGVTCERTYHEEVTKFLLTMEPGTYITLKGISTQGDIQTSAMTVAATSYHAFDSFADNNVSNATMHLVPWKFNEPPQTNSVLINHQGSVNNSWNRNTIVFTHGWQSDDPPGCEGEVEDLDRLQCFAKKFGREITLWKVLPVHLLS